MPSHERHLTTTASTLRSPLPLRDVLHALVGRGTLDHHDGRVFEAVCRRYLADPHGPAATLYELGWMMRRRDGEPIATPAANRESLRRLATVSAQIHTAAGIVHHGPLVTLAEPLNDDALATRFVQPCAALRLELSAAIVRRFSWAAVSDDRQRATAKRVWAYLSGERWSDDGLGCEHAVVYVGDYLRRAALLGEGRAARAELTRALAWISCCDARYAVAGLELLGDQVFGHRPTVEVWEALRGRHALTRRDLRRRAPTNI